MKIGEQNNPLHPPTGTLEIDTGSFKIVNSATFAAGKNRKKVKKNLPSKTWTSSMTRRNAGSILTKMGQARGLAMVASLPPQRCP